MITLRARFEGWFGDIAVSAFRKLNNGAYGIVSCEGLKEETVMPDDICGRVIEPIFRMSEHEAQILMDDLWNCGIRPTEGAGSAGAMAATQKHLEDMRRLVFDEHPILK